jgi:hypothetical protein
VGVSDDPGWACAAAGTCANQAAFPCPIIPILRSPSPSSTPPPKKQIEDFVKKHAKAFAPALTVREVPGAYTRLILSDAAGASRASVRIENWRAATIGEYLRDKLAAGGGGGKAAAS